MADSVISVIKDRDGTDVEYTGVTKIKLNTVDGDTQIFSEGEAVEGVEISLDFSNGDQTITAPDGKLVKSAIIKKPDTLVPENIALDTIVAGVVGTFESGNFNTDNLVEIVPETFVEVPSGGDGTVPVMQPIGLEAGNIYQIIWNNVSYILEAKNITYNGIPAVAVGNDIAWGGEDNGLPFAIGEIPEEYVSYTGGAYGLIIPLDGSIIFKIAGYFITKPGSDLVKYVTFMNGDEELYRMPVLTGDDCKDPYTRGDIVTPTKESTAQFDFTYSGWTLEDGKPADSAALSAVTEDRTVYAAYTEAIRYYVVDFYDGETMLKSEVHAYGSTPEYEPAKIGFIFTGWQPEIGAVTGPISYKAVWEQLAVLDSGTCGVSVYWNLYEDNTLHIYGEGAMTEYTSASAQPWYNYASTIESVVIEYGVTTIGGCAFRKCNTLKNIAIPYSISSIGASAFRDCKGLLSIEIPNSVTNIGTWSFAGAGLQSIDIPDSVTTIETYAFSYCTDLVSVLLPDKLATITTYMFRESTKLTSIIIPASVTSIGQWAFYGTGLTSAEFEVTSIWHIYSSDTETSGQTIDETSLANTSMAATYLKTTYSNKWWKRT